MAFDPSLYDTVPQTNVPGTLAVVRAILTHGKVVTMPAAKKALRRLRESGEALRQLHQAVPPAKAESIARDADNAVDRIWSAIEHRLAAHLELEGDEAAEAARVHALLFPNGLAFLKLKYNEEWAESEAALGRISSEQLEGALNALVGEKFLAALRERHRAYGVALGITKPKSAQPDERNLVEPLREVRRALSTYARVVVAATENGDLATNIATQALAPLASLRESVRAAKRKGDAGAPPPDPSSAEPLPPVE